MLCLSKADWSALLTLLQSLTQSSQFIQTLFNLTTQKHLWNTMSHFISTQFAHLSILGLTDYHQCVWKLHLRSLNICYSRESSIPHLVIWPHHYTWFQRSLVISIQVGITELWTTLQCQTTTQSHIYKKKIVVVGDASP